MSVAAKDAIPVRTELVEVLTSPSTSSGRTVHNSARYSLSERKPRSQDRVICAFCGGKGGGGEINFPEKVEFNAAGGHGAKRAGRVIPQAEATTNYLRAASEASNALYSSYASGSLLARTSNSALRS